MRQILLVTILTLISLQCFSNPFDESRKGTEYFEGDPNQNEILENGEDYIVIRNYTAKAEIPYYYEGTFLFNEPAEVFRKEGERHCKKNRHLDGQRGR